MTGENSSIDGRELEEISRLLEDKVSLAILAHIVDRGRCTQEYLENLDAVTKESRDLLRSLIERGIIEENDGELKITEKGRNLLKIFRKCESLETVTGTARDLMECDSEEKRNMTEYFALYELMYENPLIPCKDIAEKTGMPLKNVSLYLMDMYEKSILKGPVLSVKPAENYHQYAYFLKVTDPLTVCQALKGEHILYRSVSCGTWNVLVITDEYVDYSSLPQVQECIVEGVKSATYMSKVTVLDFGESVKRIRDAITPQEKTTLYEEISGNPWDEEEWRLYRTFKENVRCTIVKRLKECLISPTKYRDWISSADQFALMQPAFYPGGLNNYCAVDILFCSHYHQQLRDVLGLLPSTSIFFSVNDYLFARLFFLNEREVCDIFTLIDKRKEFYTTYSFALFTVVYR